MAFQVTEQTAKSKKKKRKKEVKKKEKNRIKERKREKQMKQGGKKKQKKLPLKVRAYKWDTNEHLEGINTRKKINLCFSSSAKISLDQKM